MFKCACVYGVVFACVCVHARVGGCVYIALFYVSVHVCVHTVCVCVSPPWQC